MKKKLYNNMFNYSELYDKFIELIPKNGKFIEIGVLQGTSLLHAVEYAEAIGKNIKFYGIDIFGEGNSWEVKNKPELISKLEEVQELFNEHKNVFLLKGYSNDKDILSNFKNNSIDIVFVDGDHSFDGCYQDLINYYPFIKKGGIMAGHDYNLQPVKEAVNKFKVENNIKELKLYYNLNFRSEVISWYFTKEKD